MTCALSWADVQQLCLPTNLTAELALACRTPGPDSLKLAHPGLHLYYLAALSRLIYCLMKPWLAALIFHSLTTEFERLALPLRRPPSTSWKLHLCEVVLSGFFEILFKPSHHRCHHYNHNYGQDPWVTGTWRGVPSAAPYREVNSYLGCFAEKVWY